METIEDIMNELRGISGGDRYVVIDAYAIADRLEAAHNAEKTNAMNDINTLMLKDEKVRLIVALAEDYKRKAEKLQAVIEGLLGRCVTCDKDCKQCGSLYAWVPGVKTTLKEVTR